MFMKGVVTVRHDLLMARRYFPEVPEEARGRIQTDNTLRMQRNAKRLRTTGEVELSFCLTKPHDIRTYEGVVE
jgi:hypothetical protein